jgi:hypothetical protein
MKEKLEQNKKTFKKREPMGSPESWLDWLLREASEYHKSKCEKFCRPLDHDIECTRNSFRRGDAKEVIQKALKKKTTKS